MAFLTAVTTASSLNTAISPKIQEIRIVDTHYKTSFKEDTNQTISKTTISTRPNNATSKVVVKHVARGGRKDGSRSISLRDFPLNTPGQVQKLTQLLKQIQSGSYDHEPESSDS